MVMNEALLQIVQALERQLVELEDKSNEPLLLMEEAIGLCSLSLLEMKERVLKEGFSNVKNEIQFFKELKPKVYSQLIYYLKLLKIETLCSALTKDGQINYLSATIKDLEQYYVTHADLYKYYRLKLDYLDEQYFLRDGNQEVKDIDHIYQMLDGQFSAPQDHVWGTFKAHQRLIPHLEWKLEHIKKGNDQKQGNKYHWLEQTPFRWTDAKVALVELIYAIHSSRSVNDGRFEIKKMVRLFELVFNIELRDAYRIYLNIRGRKIERTRYLDHLKRSLLKRMDEWDNKDLNNV